MSPSIPRFIAFAVGFLSLSQEILWTRVVSFSYLTKPQAFSLVLAMYLLGIALGAAAGRIACRKSSNLLATGGAILIVAGLSDIALLAFYGIASGGTAALPALAIAVIITAALKSALFPIVHHLGSNDVALGKGVSFSRVYVSNVFGSALGPIVAGLILLQWATLQQSFVIISALTLALGCFSLLRAGRREAGAFAGVLIILTTAAILAPNLLIPALSTAKHESQPIVVLHENRNGVVHTLAGGDDGDIVFGNNVYDGRINTDLGSNKNGIHRAYVLATLHQNPRRVLVIGLSGGAWTKVISMFPTVEKMDVVEINPAYLKLIERYPEVSPILSDERIEFHIDDGRRWLRLNPEERYDLIVMNSIHHWRANATNLLSSEFMTLARQHLDDGGIFYVNSTDSPDVLNTASSVFEHAYRYDNFVAASNVDFRANIETYRDRYITILGSDPRMAGLSTAGRESLLQEIYEVPFETLEEVRLSSHRELEVVRDDNMITEYKYGSGFF